MGIREDKNSPSLICQDLINILSRDANSLQYLLNYCGLEVEYTIKLAVDKTRKIRRYWWVLWAYIEINRVSEI